LGQNNPRGRKELKLLSTDCSTKEHGKRGTEFARQVGGERSSDSAVGRGKQPARIRRKMDGAKWVETHNITEIRVAWRCFGGWGVYG